MYNDFAKYYDTLMSDADYGARADYICELFARFGEMPERLIDLACGTGNMSVRFAEKGISVTGVDISAEMLAVAQKKTFEAGLDVFYLCQPAQELELIGEADGAVCLLDSLNHITDYGDFCEVFVKVSENLKKCGLFIFDVNTEYKHEFVLADNTFVIEEDNVYCVWQNFYDKKNKATDILLDFFEKQGDHYVRGSENFRERAYGDGEIFAAAEKAGFKTEAVFGDMSYNAPSENEERKVFVLKKT